jgi:hypothetical protein
MAYDPTPEESERWPAVARGMAQWRQFFSFKRGYVRLEPKVASFYRDAETVNRVLKTFMDADTALRGPRLKTA